MELGGINIEELEQLKSDLFDKASDPLINDALIMIQKLEKLTHNMVMNHNEYVGWAVRTIKRLEDRVSDYSWATNPDTSGGAFRQDEIDRSRNGGW